MVEKFSDYETGFINQEGDFVFEVKEAELTDSKSGNPMVKFLVKADEGQSTLYFSLSDKARWKYNKFIQACLKLTPEERRTFELDYFLIHNQLIGKKFIGGVECGTYEKVTKKQTDDGLFEDVKEIKESYSIETFSEVED